MRASLISKIKWLLCLERVGSFDQIVQWRLLWKWHTLKIWWKWRLLWNENGDYFENDIRWKYQKYSKNQNAAYAAFSTGWEWIYLFIRSDYFYIWRQDIVYYVLKTTFIYVLLSMRQWKWRLLWKWHTLKICVDNQNKMATVPEVL